MRSLLALFLGRPVPCGEFEGTEGERRVYEYAKRQWRAAGFKVKSERLLNRTLGANVQRAA